MLGYFGKGNETSGSTKGRECFHYLTDCSVFKRGSALWSQLVTKFKNSILHLFISYCLALLITLFYVPVSQKMHILKNIFYQTMCHESTYVKFSFHVGVAFTDDRKPPMA
jgi:hypothetical protein